MLNFLRKIRKSLINSGSAKRPASPAGGYFLYAIGEIALVVIGILIALQINNWNEWRQDRKLEQETLEDLKLNLETNVVIIKDRISYLNGGQNSGKIVLNVIDQGLSYHDSLGAHFFRATRGYGGADIISYAGYEALKNNGFGLITNKQLRDEIINLFETTYRVLISIDETFKLQNAYHKEAVGHLLYSDKSNSLKPFDFKELLASRGYYSSVSDHLHNYKWMKEETAIGLSKTERVLQLIKDELGKSE